VLLVRARTLVTSVSSRGVVARCGAGAAFQGVG